MERKKTMNKILSRVICECSILIKYVLLIISLLIVLVTIICILFRNKVFDLITNNFNFSIMEGISLNFIVYYLICIMGITLCLSFVFHNFHDLILNLGEKRYFTDENPIYCKRIFLLLMIITALKFSTEVAFKYLYFPDINILFQISLKSYFFNVIFIIISYASFLVFKHGKTIRDDSESII